MFLAAGVDKYTKEEKNKKNKNKNKKLARNKPKLGTSLLGGGRVYYRDRDGRVNAATRKTFGELAREGSIGADTPTFDTSVTTAVAWREEFERPV